MRKVELLSPVGNKDMLYQAIHNGADAVYLSGVNYGARKFANNFTNEELVEAIKLSHLYGVKVYVTVNTLIHEVEMDDVLEYLGFLHGIGVDAVIMQDMGLIKITREIYPNLEIHASTQCHNHNNEIIKLWKNLGVTRVVMAREMSLDDIKNIDTDIEKEVFVYGALCVCYSGCCLFSSLNGGRSGNRGECVGSCRLPYKLIKNNEVVKTDGNFILSTKELNTLDHIKELIEAGITSFKIEGRMKSPSYVGYVTRIFRMLIDKYYNGEEVRLSGEELNNLKKLFNREFTDGYLFNGQDIMNIKTPNHQGVEIGSVIDVYNGKLKIKLSDDLSQNDGIRFKNKDNGMMINRLYNERGLLISSASKGSVCLIDNKLNISKGDIVLKTIDSKLNDWLDNILEKKIGISMRVTCLIGESLELVVTDGVNEVVVKGGIIDKALNREVTCDDIIKQLSKLGNTPFRLDKIDINKDDNIFVNLKNLNEVRRDAIERLVSLRDCSKGLVVKNTFRDDTKNKVRVGNIYLSVLVRSEEQLKVCLENNISNIYVTDYDLYNKYKSYNNVYYRLDRVMNNYLDYKNERLLVGELGSVYKYGSNNEIIADYYLNVTNHYSVKLLEQNGVKRVTLSVELNDYKIRDIMEYVENAELIIYGRLELMVMKYCPLKKCLNYCNNCKNSNDKFYLEDKFSSRYPMIRHNCLTHIMHCNIIDKIDNIADYKDMGIRYYRLELFDENKNQVKDLIDRFCNNM